MLYEMSSSWHSSPPTKPNPKSERRHSTQALAVEEGESRDIQAFSMSTQVLSAGPPNVVLQK